VHRGPLDRHHPPRFDPQLHRLLHITPQVEDVVAGGEHQHPLDGALVRSDLDHRTPPEVELARSVGDPAVRQRRAPRDPHAQVSTDSGADMHLLGAGEARCAGAGPRHHRHIGAQAVEEMARLHRHQSARAAIERRPQVRVVVDTGRRYRHNQLAGAIEGC